MTEPTGNQRRQGTLALVSSLPTALAEIPLLINGSPLTACPWRHRFSPRPTAAFAVNESSRCPSVDFHFWLEEAILQQLELPH